MVFGIVFFLTVNCQAQAARTTGGSPPAWGPVGNSQVRYYYLPDVIAFYDVKMSMFIYFENKTWVRKSYLPSRYRNYDLYKGFKVVMKSYNGYTPYTHFCEFKRRYAPGYNGEIQKTIGERPEVKSSADKYYGEAIL